MLRDETKRMKNTFIEMLIVLSFKVNQCTTYQQKNLCSFENLVFKKYYPWAI